MDSLDCTDKKFSEEPNLEEIRKTVAEFAEQRNWTQFHTPRNLLLALVGEVGELAEIFQWKGEVEPGLKNWNDQEKKHLEEELSDVFIYLIRLADSCNVDLTKAALEKIEQNRKKYPIELVFGKSKKYTEYETGSSSDPSKP